MGALATILSGITLTQWIQLAGAAPSLIKAAESLGEDLAPVIALFGKRITGGSGKAAINAQVQWKAAAVDFQAGGDN